MTVWEKITGSPGPEGRAGLIPVFDQGVWRLFRNTYTIWPYVENSSDPAKVDKLRQNVVSLMEKYPDTVPQLEKLGVRVKALLKRPIENHQDMVNWANFIFNTGPISNDPFWVADAKALASDEISIEVRSGRHPVWVLPADDGKSTIDFSAPGSKVKYGARHEFSKAALQGSQKPPVAPQSDPKPPVVSQEPNGAVRPRGRPRKDGLVPGSEEAKAADTVKRAERAAERRARLKAGNGQIVEMPQRRKLARVGASA